MVHGEGHARVAAESLLTFASILRGELERPERRLSGVLEFRHHDQHVQVTLAVLNNTFKQNVQLVKSSNK